MSWEPLFPCGFSPCGVAFGASRRNYSAACNFYADQAGPPNRIIWYPVADDACIYEGRTVFWPRLDTPPSEANSAFEAEGKGGIVRAQWDHGDIFHRIGIHVHGPAEAFEGKANAADYWTMSFLLLNTGEPLLLSNGTALVLQKPADQPCKPFTQDKRVRFAGLANGTCNGCAAFGLVTKILHPNPPNSARWSSDGEVLGELCSVIGDYYRIVELLGDCDKWTLHVRSSNIDQTYATYESDPDEDYDGYGDLAMHLVSHDAWCSNWPATITVEDVP